MPGFVQEISGSDEVFIHIPFDIARALDIHEGDFVDVKIKKPVLSAYVKDNTLVIKAGYTTIEVPISKAENVKYGVFEIHDNVILTKKVRKGLKIAFSKKLLSKLGFRKGDLLFVEIINVWKKGDRWKEGHHYYKSHREDQHYRH